jgi:flagellar biosynthesis protein FliP
MGITVVWPNIQNFSSVSQIESSYQISINKEKLTEYFSKDSITTIAGNQFTDGLKAFVILIPFIIIDLVALILFRVLDLGSYPIDFLTIPLKIILFLSVDGVNLIFKILGIGA